MQQSNLSRSLFIILVIALLFVVGCPVPTPPDDEADEDNDGVDDSEDDCPDTPSGEQANAQGCSDSQLDIDDDDDTTPSDTTTTESTLKHDAADIRITIDGTQYDLQSWTQEDSDEWTESEHDVWHDAEDVKVKIDGTDYDLQSYIDDDSEPWTESEHDIWHSAEDIGVGAQSLQQWIDDYEPSGELFAGCGEDNLVLCTDEESCEAAGGEWTFGATCEEPGTTHKTTQGCVAESDEQCCTQGNMISCGYWPDLHWDWGRGLCCIDGPASCVAGTWLDCASRGHREWTGSYCCIEGNVECREDSNRFLCGLSGDKIWTGRLCCETDIQDKTTTTTTTSQNMPVCTQGSTYYGPTWHYNGADTGHSCQGCYLVCDTYQGLRNRGIAYQVLPAVASRSTIGWWSVSGETRPLVCYNGLIAEDPSCTIGIYR